MQNCKDQAGSIMFKLDEMSKFLTESRAVRIYLQQGLFGAATLKPTVLQNA